MQATSKKFNILQELEQAIKRKAIDKQKSREHTNKQLLLSIDKRRAENRSAYHKDKSSDKKESRKTPSKDEQPYVMKPFILNNQNRAEPRRSLGKRLDKLLSLVNYTVSSAEKAIKFVNTANFEAEFAVKLFKSDRDALMLEIESFSQEEAARSPNPSNPSLDTLKNSGTGIATLENHSLKNENATLRKENLLAEAEVGRLKEEKTLLATQLRNLKQLLGSEDKKERGRIKDKEREIDNLLKEIHDIDGLKKADKGRESLLKHHLFLKEKELEHLKDLMRPAYPPELENFFETIQKETKFNLMLFSNQDNMRKKTELEALLKSLETERVSYERKLQPTDQRPMARVTEFRTFLRQKLAPMLDLQTTDLTDLDILEACLRELQEKPRQKKVSSTKQVSSSVAALEREVAQLQSEKASLANQIEILKIHNGRDKNDEYRKAIKENDLLKANIEEIYEDLKGICIKCKLLPNLTEDEVDFQKIIDAIRTFSQEKSRDGTVSREQKRDPQKNMLAVELASEKKAGREKAKLLQQTQLEMTKMQERINELQGDLDKVTRRLEKYDNQKTAGSGQTTKLKDQMRIVSSQLQASQKVKGLLTKQLNESKKTVRDLEDKLEKKDKKEKGLEETLQQMRKSQDFLKLQLEKMKHQKGSLEQTIQDLKNQIEQKSHQISIKTQQFPTQDLQKALSETANELQKTLKSSQKMGSELDKARLELDRSRKDLNQAREQLRSLEDEVLRLGKIIKSQQLQLASHKESSSQVQPLEQQIHKLKQQLEKQTARARQQEADLTSLEKDNMQMIQNLAKLEQEKKKLEMDKERLKEEKERMTKDDDGSKEEYMERLEKEMGFLEQEVTELKAKIKNLNNSLVSERAVKAELEDKISTLNEQIQTLKQSAAPVTGVNNPVFEEEIKTLKEKNEQNEQDLIEYHEKMAVLEGKIKQQNEEKEQTQKDFAVLIQKGIKKDNQIAKLQNQIEILQRKLQEYEFADNETQEHKQKASKLQTKIHDLQTEKVKATSKYNQILQKNKKLQAEVQKSIAKQQQLQLQIYELKNSIPEPKQASPQKPSKSNTIQIQSLKTTNASLSKEIDILKEQLNQALIQKLQIDLERINSIEKQHRHEQSLLRKQIELLGINREELKNVIEQKDKILAQRQTDLKKLKEQLKKQKEASKQTQSILKQEMIKLQERVSQLTNELTVAQKQDESRLSRASEEGIILKNFMMQAEKQKEIQQMKMLNYSNLVKSILKRIVDIDELQNEDLDTLLEKGAQKVFQWKKNRVWDSARKQQPTYLRPITEFNPPAVTHLVEPPIKDEPKPAKKYQTPNRIPTQELQTGNLDDFGEFQEHSMSDSMISNQNLDKQHGGEDGGHYEHFIQDLKTNEPDQKLELPKQHQIQLQTENKPTVEEEVKQTKTVLPVVQQTKPEVPQPTVELKEMEQGLLENLDDFAQMGEGSLDGSMISQKQVMETIVHEEKQHEKEILPAQLPIKNQAFDDFANFIEHERQISSIKKVQTHDFAAFSFPEVKIIDSLSDLNKGNDDKDLHTQQSEVQSQSTPKNQKKLQQKAEIKESQQKEPILDQDEFADFKEDELSQSMVSDKGLGDDQHKQVIHVQQPKKEPEPIVQPIVEPHKAPAENQELNANLFEDFKDISMEGSQIFKSNIRQETEHTVPVQEPQQHVQQQQKQIDPEQHEKKQDNLGMDQFADFQENSMNASMMSEKGVAAETSHPVNQEKYQQKHEQNHEQEQKESKGQRSGELGLSQFGDFKQQNLQGSMLAAITSPANQNAPNINKILEEANQQQAQNKPQQKEQQNLGQDEFADFKQNSLSESMMSNKGFGAQSQDKPHTQEAKKSGNDLLEFEAFKDHSISKQVQKSDLFEQVSQHKEEKKPTTSQISAEPKQKKKTEGSDAAFDEFASYHAQSMSKSQLGKDFDDFPDELERALDSSMMSNHGQPPHPVNQGQLHNILEGQHLQAFDHQHKHDFETFLQGQMGGRLSNRSQNSNGNESPRHQ